MTPGQQLLFRCIFIGIALFAAGGLIVYAGQILSERKKNR